MTNTQIILFLVLPLMFSLIIILWLNGKKRNTQMKTLFIINLTLLVLWFINLILQILLSTYYNINPLFFENFIYISACLMPIFIYFISLVFKNPKMVFRLKHIMYFIVPIITLIIIWTNEYHHLFYKEYSILISDTKFGPYFYVHSIYTYTILVFGLLNLLIHSIKTSGVFSKQSILFFIGTIIPVLLNVLGTLKVVTMTIYLTPISFSVGIVCYLIAIFKYDFLNVMPIALELVVNTISDGYIVLDVENIIVDCNKAFVDFFDVESEKIKNKYIFDFTDFVNIFKEKNLIKFLAKCKSGETINIENRYNNKYFMITISPIYKDDVFMGTLIFLNDITQHKRDMQIIQDNQTMLIEKERLASLGQMIGGIAHNLKTPIFSIAGGLEGLVDLINEYDDSIEDHGKMVTDEDMHEIASDMMEWIEKLKSHVSYMSDVITAVKGQAVTFSDDEIFNFTVEELFKQVDILMKHDLKNALIDFNIQNNVSNSYVINGNINSLVQAINNCISNSMESYNEVSNKKINLFANIEEDDSIINDVGEDINNGTNKENSNQQLLNKKKIVISIQDFGSGIPEDVQEKLFKEMITTKGKDGTGLGLFMAYSTIKANFHGDMTFESKVNKGTTFNISIPVEMKLQ